ncbi:MAG: hypothetical protein JO307_11135 [Bryobacterales bacterium]|nr:hypothetical protein [Bryobacterales bacterium]
MIEDRGAAGTTVRVVFCDMPMYDAVIRLVWAAETAEVATGTVADVAPAAIVTVEGRAVADPLDDSVTVAPAEGAGPDKLIRHALESPPATVPGAHAIEETITPEKTVSVAPSELLPADPVILTVIDVPGYVSAKLNEAMMPFEMMLEFIPFRAQLYVPKSIAQDNVFPAAVAAGPGVPVTIVTSPAGKFRVHCKAEGSLPAGEESERFIITFVDEVVPSAPPGDNVKAGWAHRKLQVIKTNRIKNKCLCTGVSHPLFGYRSFPSLR